MINSTEINYSTTSSTHPIYKYLQILPQIGSQTVNLTAVGVQVTNFIIPASVCNLSKSYITFTSALPAGGAGGTYNWVHTNGFPYINRIRFLVNSMPLADIQNLHNYLNMVMRPLNEINDVITWDKLVQEGLQLPAGGISVRPDNSAAATPIFEPAYLEVGADNTASPTLSINMRLDKILNTIFSVNKSLYFGGANATIEITWNTTGYIYYTGTSATNPTSGAVAGTTATLSNLTLQLAIDKNLDTELMVRNKVEKEGLKLVVPYIVSNFIPINAATVHNVQQSYNSTNGKVLQEIYYAPFVSGTANNAIYNHSNVAAANVTSFQTFADSIPLQTLPYNCATFDDYFMNRDKLRGSTIMSVNEYYYNWCYHESFTKTKSLVNESSENNEIDGRRLGSEILQFMITVYCPGASSFTHTLYAKTLKELTITRDGIAFD